MIDLLFDCITKPFFSQMFTKIQNGCIIVIIKFCLTIKIKLLHNLINEK